MYPLFFEHLHYQMSISSDSLFVPFNAFVVPGEPYPLENDLPPAHAPAPPIENFPGTNYLLVMNSEVLFFSGT